jgi:hypothetical protein
MLELESFFKKSMVEKRNIETPTKDATGNLGNVY